jgi:hypothetical protein
LRIRRPQGVLETQANDRFVEDSRPQWGVEDAALSPRDFFNGLLGVGGTLDSVQSMRVLSVCYG